MVKINNSLKQNVDVDFIALAVRKKRNVLLEKSDWAVLTDSPLSIEQKQAYIEYRQSLRDISGQQGFPFNVVFPQPPQQ